MLCYCGVEWSGVEWRRFIGGSRPTRAEHGKKDVEQWWWWWWRWWCNSGLEWDINAIPTSITMSVMSGSSKVTCATLPAAWFQPPGCLMAASWIHWVLDVHMHMKYTVYTTPLMKHVFYGFLDPTTVTSSSYDFASPCLPFVVMQRPQSGTTGNLMFICNGTAFSLVEPMS